MKTNLRSKQINGGKENGRDKSKRIIKKCNGRGKSNRGN